MELKNVENYMASFLSKNLVFNDSIQLMNVSLEKLVKNLSDDDFKYLTKKFVSKNLELLKQKDVHLYEYMDNFERIKEKNYLIKNTFKAT